MKGAPSEEIASLFERARQFESIGDIYNAVKLYKRIAKIAPEWLPPFIQLTGIYKARQEWKAALHFAKKVVALDPALQDGWWDLGIAAAATGKERLAKMVWQKFGEKTLRNTAVSLRLQHSGIFELVGAQVLDPVRAVITSIPHPDSGRRFRDLVLFDRQVTGIQVVNRRKLPVYNELGLLKSAHYLTFTCVLSNAGPEDIQLLENLCLEADLGFEIWSNAAWAKTVVPQKGRIPEFYSNPVPANAAGEKTWAAIASRRLQPVRAVLKAWKVITLKEYSELEQW